MPYFVYKVFAAKKLECVTVFEKFSEAKAFTRNARQSLTPTDTYALKVIFAKSEAEAKLLLKEEREYQPYGDD